jgi:transposase
MVRGDCWREVHRLFHVERRSKSEIARKLNLDRKTVRGILQVATWQPNTRAERADTCSPSMRRSCGPGPRRPCTRRVSFFQELRRARGYRGSHETVKRSVRPLRTAKPAGERPTVRFETLPASKVRSTGARHEFTTAVGRPSCTCSS